MNRYLSLACSLVAFFYLSSYESYNEPTEKAHQSDQPIVLTSFYPKEGGARDRILLDGKNFDIDVSKIKVYFDNARASVVSSSGSRIYTIIPRLPGDNPRISVVIDTDSVAYKETYAYHAQALVSTVTGNGEASFLVGALSAAQVYDKYLNLDAEGNLLMLWRDGGTFGIAQINEQQNIVTPLIEVDAANRILYANGLTVDRATGVLTAAHESVEEATFTFDLREAWYSCQRNIKYSQSDLSSIVDADRYKNLVTFRPHDDYPYTRYHNGKIAKIDPNTFEGHIIHQGPSGSQYGQVINPTKPWFPYITSHSSVPTAYRQGISVLDFRGPDRTGGFKRPNAPGGGAFRDDPIEDALFNYPKDIKFDNDGNMFVTNYGSHCIRMISADSIVATVAGQPGVTGYKDGESVKSLFESPRGVAVSEQRDIYIVDWGNARIRKLVIE